MKLKEICLAAAIAALSVPAFAHHSFALFDYDKSVDIAGTVKSFQWTNPHSWLNIVVVDDKGKQEEWSLEMGSLAQNERMGWQENSVAPGDKVIARFHPLKSGSRGGSLVSVKLKSGKTLGIAWDTKLDFSK